MQSLMGETTPVAHGGDPQDRTGSPRPRCIANFLGGFPPLGQVTFGQSNLITSG
ncbi:hypothetical protein [Moorena producens]|uniref:hypothetical protein n=1 Tax=Moorena producens TaxID=1155739 RepID=UPI00131410E8|nr:hypothetical protein [Moorena producens]